MNEYIEKCQYPMDPNKRGVGIIIVNIFKKYDAYFRNGAGFEIEKLHELFTLMGLEVRQHEELKRDEIVKVLEEVTQEERLKTDSMIAVGISSHGCEAGLLGINVEGRIECDLSAKGPYDGKDDCISSAEIRSMLNGANCPNLAGKPKLLLLNGCRGYEREDLIKADGPGTPIPAKRITTRSDFFTINSCQPGTISLRSDRVGSLFIDEFLDSYKLYGSQLPLDMLMPIVNRKLIDTCARKVRGAMQSCNWESSCTSIFKLTPINAVIPKVQPVASPKHQMGVVWSTATKGTQGPNQMSSPQGLTITPSGEIYITDPAAQCIWVYSEDGEPMYQDIQPKVYKQLAIENLGLKYAWGICVFKNFLFVSSSLAIIKFSMKGDSLNHKIHKFPLTGLDIDKEGNVYACERQSCNVILLDQDLNVKDKIKLTPALNPAKDRLMDIKVLGQEMYVLVNNSDYTIQIFDVKGTHLRNLVSKDVLNESLFIAIDRNKRFLYAGDLTTNELKAFDENGQLLCKIGEHGDRRGNFAHPNGVGITSNGQVVAVCSIKSKFMLQCFRPPL